MAKIIVDPLHSSVFANSKFYFETSESWLSRYSHPQQLPSGEEPSVYIPDSGGTSGTLVFGWVPYALENFNAKYFPVFPTGDSVSIREVHLISGTGLDQLDDASRIKSDTLVVEWTIDGGKTVSQYQLEKIEVSEGLSVHEFYDQTISVFLSGDDQVNGTAANDLIDGFSGSDSLFAYEGNDYITGGIGNDLIDGGTGIDCAVFMGSIDQYAINLVNSSVSDFVDGRDGIDTLNEVERLKFSDTSVALDIAKDEAAGSAYRLYKAAFDRAPDLGGLGYWIDQLDNGGTLQMAASGFIHSAEFESLYGANSSDTLFVTKLYNNVLDRNPDQGGYDYWLGQMENGMSRESVLINFSESNENISNVAGLIANGIQYQEWLL